ncbi:MAG: single-stranded-DNA-specific exonuclease RecJ [Paludibacteraceae bacterium]|nr:single-stranded-DNA-specific exonuclease RecJ [Paludibacteraceae bacterium]
MKPYWDILQLTDEQKTLCQSLAKELKISVLSAQLLVDRGITTADAAKQYIRPSLDKLHDPYLMKDMEQAVTRLDKAIQNNERILVYGDYDVDGTTAVALVYSFLKDYSQNLDYYIPDRYTEGYGISYKGVDYAKETGCTLIIALDCGIKEMAKVEYATGKGIDFIIADHHTPGDEIPKAVAVLNMKRNDCTYPYKELSGCGVGFKLVQAYARRRTLPDNQYLSLLGLLAMSIASDIVPLTGENRILAYYGLKQLNSAPSAGLQALMKVAGIETGKLTFTDLVFKIGPRINACGRLYSGREAVELLITTDTEFAANQAENINTYNTERKDYDETTTREALAMLNADPDNETKHTTVVYSPAWHKGVVGIAASRLTETYYRPTIVLTAGENGIISGSARSVHGFDLYSAIDSCRDLLTNFGGHAFAAGLSMREEDLPKFKQRFEKYVAEHIREDQLYPTIPIEAEIDFADITPQFFQVLKCLEPFGPENPRPTFVTRHVVNNRYTKAVGKEQEHLKLDVTDCTAAIGGIAFGKGDLALHLQNGNPIDVCYELYENHFNGTTTIQMMVQDIHIPDKNN